MVDPESSEEVGVKLASRDLLADREPLIDAARGALASSYDLAMFDDPVAGQSLKFYVLLTDYPRLVSDLGLSAEELFWSRYYWFLRFARLRQAIAGVDVGMEDFGYRILAYPQPECQPDYSN